MKWFDGLGWGVQLIESGNVHAAFASKSDAFAWAQSNPTFKRLYQVVQL